MRVIQTKKEYTRHPSPVGKERIPSSFFERDAEVVARDLLGCVLVVKNEGGEEERVVINETEAYVGEHDLACHASKGRTGRTEVMYDEAGTVYMYLIYGMYWMFNIVTGKKESPAAVLVRGAGAFNGPGKLTRALGITGERNSAKLGISSGVWIEQGHVVLEEAIVSTPRINVEYAKEWAEKPLRFFIAPESEKRISL